jgi:hypothetical protein
MMTDPSSLDLEVAALAARSVDLMDVPSVAPSAFIRAAATLRNRRWRMREFDDR